MLIERDMRQTKRRVEVELLDEATNRVFLLTHYFSGASGADPIETMVLGKHGSWTASEMRPNGVVYNETTKCSHEIRGFGKSGRLPASAWAAVKAEESNNPGFVAVSFGGGRCANTIYYARKDEAMRAINNALDTDTWVIEDEPVRKKTVSPNCQITLEADSRLERASGREQIKGALRDIEAALTKTDFIEVSLVGDRIRVEVVRKAIEYPANLRLCIEYPAAGLCLSGGCHFSRAPYHALADQLAGIPVPHYDDMEARGLPPYGMSRATPSPDGHLCLRCLHNTANGNDKLYAHVVVGKKDYAVWGGFDGGLRCKMFPHLELSERTWKKRTENYIEIDEDKVPNFWARVAAAIAGLA